MLDFKNIDCPHCGAINEINDRTISNGMITCNTCGNYFTMRDAKSKQNKHNDDDDYFESDFILDDDEESEYEDDD